MEAAAVVRDAPRIAPTLIIKAPARRAAQEMPLVDRKHRSAATVLTVRRPCRQIAASAHTAAPRIRPT